MNTGKSKRGPLQHRIIYCTLICILLICAIVSVISFYLFRNYLRNGIIMNNSISLSNLSEAVDTEMNEVYRLVRYCQSSNNITNYIQTNPVEDPVKINRIHDLLTEEYQSNIANSYITRVAIIKDTHYLHLCPTTHSTVLNVPSIIENLPYYKTLLQDDTYNFSCGIVDEPFLKGSPKYMIPIVRPIIYKYNSDRIGYVFMEFSPTLITDQLKKYHMESDDILLFLMGDYYYKFENGQLLALTEEEKSMASVVSSYSLSSGVEVKELKAPEGHFTVLLSPVKMKDCYIAQVISPSGIRSERQVFLFLFSFVLICVIGIGIVLNIYLDRLMYKPVNRIRSRLVQTAAGDFSVDPSIEGNHELGEIGKGINDLSSSINSLLENKLEDEKKKKDLEYQMLLNQINPHFLYNTLNSIKMMGQVQGATGIVEMTTSLASLLRSISKSTQLIVPISEELSLVQHYFTIQNYRYGGMIDFQILLDDETIANSHIVKFTLQPLVENAIFHGLEPKGGIGYIHIHLYYRDENTICIDVIDNGVGIPPEKVKDILNENAKASNDFFKEIGIHNVNKRIQYEFGDSYGISVISVQGESTTMRVVLPGED